MLILDKGFVELESSNASDESVIRAARVSYGKTTTTPERDKRLIKYLIEHKHSTPCEHNSFTFHIKTPLFVARQWMRHRIGLSYNEISARYTEMKDEFYIPDIYRGPDTVNKQGSIPISDSKVNETAKNIVLKASQEAYENYKNLIQNGVANEMARMVLPVNIYTEFYFTCNAHSLMHFIGLRSEKHAQAEIQRYSDAMFAFFKEKMPWTAEAFLETLDIERYPGLKLHETTRTSASV